MISSEKLKSLRELAMKAKPWDAEDNEATIDKWEANKENNANFCRAANPQTILSIISALEAEREKVNVMREALEEIEELQPLNERKRREIAREALKYEYNK
jgi:hypothetical protein